MKTLKVFIFLVAAMFASNPFCLVRSQTVIPNGDFESWAVHSNYNDPTSWDTPNSVLMGIPFFGQNVVFQSTDHHQGSYSAKLVTKHISIPGNAFDCPGFMTLGKLNVDLVNMTFTVTGGVPINDRPTHLMGFFKFQPVGGDSCAIGIIMYKTTAGVRDTIGLGYFSSKTAVTDWTHFSAWINYDTISTPDTMNIVALSSAQVVMNPNTTLYVDDLYLDYTVGVGKKDPGAGISVYQDKETRRLIVFFEFASAEDVVARLFDMNGREVSVQGPAQITNGRLVIPYTGFMKGIYILMVRHDGKTFTRKFLLGS